MITLKRALVPPAVLVVALALFAAACGDDGVEEPTHSVTIVEPQDGASLASPVTLVVEHGGFEVVAADGDESGETGHFHVFINTDPAPAGELIPTGAEPEIFHFAANEFELELEPGEYTATVVAADGVHRAFDASDRVAFTVTE
jgi:hypothetical protein